MKIGKKIFINTVFFSGFVIFTLVIISWGFLQKPFLDLEDEETAKTLERVKVGIEKEVKKISVMNQDWSQWDDSYNFVLDLNESYINANINSGVLMNLDINFIAYLNNQDKVVFIYGIDFATEEEKDFSAIVKSIISDSRFKEKEKIEGVINLKDYNPVIISSRPILKSDGSNPAVGTLIFGRLVDDETIKNIIDMTIFPVNIQKIDSSLDAKSSKAVSDLATKNFVVDRESNKLYGYSFIRDVYGSNPLLIKTEIERNIYNKGFDLIKMLVIFVPLAGFLSVVIFTFFIQRIVVKPLSRLEESVKKASATADPNEIIVPNSKDEISFLSNIIKKSFNDEGWVREQIKRGEAEYRRIFELSPEAIVMLDNKGNLTDTNNRLTEWLGYKKEEILGKNILNFPFFSRKTKLEVIKKFAQRMMGKEIPVYDLEFIGKDGNIRIGRLRGVPIRDENNKIIRDLVMVSDVTEVKKIEKTLEESEEKHRVIFDEAQDGIFTMDLQGRVVSGNKKAEEMIGYKEEEVSGKKFTEFLKGKDVMKGLNVFKELILKRKEEYISEISLLRRDGTFLPVEIKGNILKKEGKIIGVLGIARDISERKEAEKKLKDAKERIEKEKVQDEAILENIAEGLIVTDPNGKILFFNKGAEEILGWQSEEVIGGSFKNFIPLQKENGKEVPERERPFELALKSGRHFMGGISEKYYYVKKDKKRFPVAIIISPLIWGQKITGVIVVFRDITKEKEVDRAKSEFVSLASHQLRTPLTTINWYIEMLLQKEAGELNKEQEKYLKDIYEASQRMTGLVGALLNVARIELGTFSIEPKEANIENIIESVLEELKPNIQKRKIKIEKNYEEKNPKIYTDPKLTRIVFQNLISNAVKYNREKGRVMINLKKRSEGKLLIQISDGGYGIPKKEQSKIFTKLYRADNIKKVDPDGTGLGLYIIKGIVEEYGGKIWFESEENVGTTFSILLPVKIIKKAGSKKIE